MTIGITLLSIKFSYRAKTFIDYFSHSDDRIDHPDLLQGF